jgi:S-DNA-T family DNA segregation ATPase FtsK/SpoIIIE
LHSAGGWSIDEGTQYADAVRLVLIERRVTVSVLQRRMRIGFGRACMLAERMHLDGITDSAGNVVGWDY